MKLHDRELAPRKRKPIEEIAFAGTWDRPAHRLSRLR